MAKDMDQRQIDYKHGKSASSLPQYITLIKEDLIPRLIKEDDPMKRKAIGKTATDRLHQLNNIVRPSVLAKEQNRRTVLSIVSKKSGKNGFVAKGNIGFNLLEEESLNEWLQFELKMDEELTAAIRNRVEDLEMDKQMLHEALQRREVIRQEVHDEHRNDFSTHRQNSGSMTDLERIALLEGLVKKQDDEVHMLQRQLDEENSNYVHILKSEYEDMVHELKPCVKRLSEFYDVPKNVTHKRSMGEKLKDNVLILVEQMDKMRDRVDQTTDALKEIEREKEVCLQMLNTEDGYILSEILAQKLQQWKDDKRNLNREIKSLRKNIDILAERNRQLMEELDKSALRIDTKECAVEKPKTTPRVRRSSAPMQPYSAKKVPEKKLSAINVGVQPKLISFGDTGSIPVKSTRKKSASSMGPMKATSTHY